MEFVFMVVANFVIGSMIGSFLGVVVDRLPEKKTIWKGRSICDSCHKKLHPLELIPIISYLMQKGRCRNCHAKIPLQVFLIECVSGISFVGIYLSLGVFTPLYTLLYVLIVLSLNIVIFFIDLQFGIIPDELIILFTIVTLIFLIVTSPGQILLHVFSAFGAFLLFLFLFLVTKGRGMGFGDVKYVAAIGFFLGFPDIVVGLYIAFLSGAVVSLLLILRGKKHLKSTIPFGPFLAIGTLIAYLFADVLLHIVFVSL